MDEIQLKLTPQEEARFARDDVIDPEAHEDYLRGLFLLNLRDGPDERKAIELFQAAVKKDPAYAAAYVSLADSYRALISIAMPLQRTFFLSRRLPRSAPLRLTTSLLKAMLPWPPTWRISTGIGRVPRENFKLRSI